MATGPAGPGGPAGPVFGAVSTDDATDPTPTPDGSPGTGAYAFTTTPPTGGPTLVSVELPSYEQSCSSGGARLGLSVDGAPIPESGRGVTTINGEAVPLTLAVVLPLAAGPHTFTVRPDCPGAPTLANSLKGGTPAWQVLRLGSG